MADASPPSDAFEHALIGALPGLGLTLEQPQITAMWRHLSTVVRQNQVMNLTRITDPVEAAVKHYADSLALVAWARAEGVQIRSLLDVGTGAGFPAFPIAIARPDWLVTAIDGTRKKIDFVRRCGAELSLDNLRTVHAHASHWGPTERFDVVALRAVAKLADAITMCTRFLADPGWLVVYKTSDTPSEEGSPADEAAKSRRLSPTVFPYMLRLGSANIPRQLHVYHLDRKT